MRLGLLKVVSLLSRPWERQFYRAQNLHTPEHPVTASEFWRQQKGYPLINNLKSNWSRDLRIVHSATKEIPRHWKHKGSLLYLQEPAASH